MTNSEFVGNTLTAEQKAYNKEKRAAIRGRKTYIALKEEEKGNIEDNLRGEDNEEQYNNWLRRIKDIEKYIEVAKYEIKAFENSLIK